MIRLIQRCLIIPRGDTGTLKIPVIGSVRGADALAVFSIFSQLDGTVILQKEIPITDDMLVIEFAQEETRELPLGRYVWDIKAYINPKRNAKNELINGDEVHSYYAGFECPICEITLARDRR